MQTYIALIRGINVGGTARLPMTELTPLLETLGCAGVRTYIQSGNAVFHHSTKDASGLATKLTAAIAKTHGFTPRVLVLTDHELARAAAANPYKEASKDPKSVHLFFLAARPEKADMKGLEALKTKTERFALKGSVFYLHTPDGFGRSKL